MYIAYLGRIGVQEVPPRKSPYFSRDAVSKELRPSGHVVGQDAMGFKQGFFSVAGSQKTGTPNRTLIPQARCWRAGLKLQTHRRYPQARGSGDYYSISAFLCFRQPTNAAARITPSTYSASIVAGKRPSFEHHRDQLSCRLLPICILCLKVSS